MRWNRAAVSALEESRCPPSNSTPRARVPNAALPSPDRRRDGCRPRSAFDRRGIRSGAVGDRLQWSFARAVSKIADDEHDLVLDMVLFDRKSRDFGCRSASRPSNVPRRRALRCRCARGARTRPRMLRFVAEHPEPLGLAGLPSALLRVARPLDPPASPEQADVRGAANRDRWKAVDAHSFAT